MEITCFWAALFLIYTNEMNWKSYISYKPYWKYGNIWKSYETHIHVVKQIKTNLETYENICVGNTCLSCKNKVEIWKYLGNLYLTYMYMKFYIFSLMVKPFILHRLVVIQALIIKNLNFSFLHVLCTRFYIKFMSNNFSLF